MSNRISIKGVEVSTDHYINGKRVSSDKKFTVINPNNPSEVLAEMSRGDVKIAKLAASLSVNNKINIIPNCGHVLHLESPVLCANTISKWI